MISVLGSINLDLTAGVKHMPAPGQTISATGFATSPGGKGANQALGAKRGGSTVRMAGAVGRDSFGAAALRELEAGGVDLSGIRNVSGPSGLALILVDENGENEIVIVPGANARVNADMARDVVAGMNTGDHLLLVQEIPAQAIRTALTMAAQAGVTSLLNIAPVTPQTKELAELADIVIANETEFAALAEADTGDNSLEEQGMRWAGTRGKTLVITLGAQGAMAFHRGKVIRVAALPVTPLDTVGAGDTFCGYLANGLDVGLDLKSALERAAVAGSLACLEHGAQPAIPSAKRVAEALEGVKA